MSFDLRIKKRIGERSIDLTMSDSAGLVALTGPSGAGKTTVLNCIAGLMVPDDGHIAIGGRTLFDRASHTNLPPEARSCGYVFQDSRLFPHLTVVRNLAYGEALASSEDRWIDLMEVACLLEIADLLDRHPASLSGGETRRVAIGRALLAAPRFLLLDEPLASLDPARGEQVLQCVERIRDELGLPMLYVSHDAAEVARLTDRVVELPLAR
ncbi:ATP-binding cassette domain-containing protein [Parerythrobacter lacustris]|uniref:ATP-binding cassette domain-containing protein n=1 Tax=Parerythrobacter lacustris TaxID=2969984 RepID=A0ABT1XRV4_9SPHN|nr:ATP-binding cassette domain-containing protein [Parerythrobacter lacustris]MCR2833147.1 ATP-binding cassette domain-containing protein [Parerythrobacter lacustris]